MKLTTGREFEPCGAKICSKLKQEEFKNNILKIRKSLKLDFKKVSGQFAMVSSL
jgi:hypothetical protein